MRFIPNFTFKIQTHHSKDVVLRRLQEITHLEEKIPNMKSRRFKELFYGQASDESFMISPVMRFLQGSFIPIIYGKVFETEEGTIVNLSMNLINSVVVFWIVWLSLCGLFFLLILCLLIFGKMSFSFGVFMPIILFCFGYGLGYFGLKHEAMICKNYLENLWSRP